MRNGFTGISKGDREFVGEITGNQEVSLISRR